MGDKANRTILVVDDDIFALEATSLLLNECGYYVVACGNAGDALERLQRLHVAAVFTDIVMPGLSGIDLLVKVHEMNPDIPVILMTGHADMDKTIDAIKKGAFDFMIKPYKPEQLLHAVEKASRYSDLVQLEREYRHILEEFSQNIESLVAERTTHIMALAVADRLRNPAAVIGGLCKRTLEKEEISEKARENICRIRDEAEKLEILVKDFQALLGCKGPNFQYEDIGGIVGRAVSITEREAANKRVRIAADYPGDPLPINMEKDLLRTAFLLLMRNAVEEAREDSVITVSVGAEGDKVIIKIADTGCGIPREIADTVFDPFAGRGKNKFGIGLQVVKQIVSEHMGEVTIESSTDRGTTYVVRFPFRWKGDKIMTRPLQASSQEDHA